MVHPRRPFSPRRRERSVALDNAFDVNLTEPPRGFVLLGVFEAQRPLLVQRRHRHAGMNGGQDLALGRTVEPVAETAQAFEEPLPELDLVGDPGRMPERPQAGDVLMWTRPSTRRVSTRLSCRRRGVERKRTNIVVAKNDAKRLSQQRLPLHGHTHRNHRHHHGRAR